jgi:tetratricopeptide (TPR) repeat protein
LAERGEVARPEAAGKLIAVARASGQPAMMAMAYAAAGKLMIANGEIAQAKTLFQELERTTGTRDDPYYAAQLPAIIRRAVGLGDQALAVLLMAGIEPRTPLQRNALAASRASIAEAADDHAEAAGFYAGAALQWRAFGDLPELGYALLGQGRCLIDLARPEAGESLGEARELFSSMGYRPALLETEALLRGMRAQGA